MKLYFVRHGQTTWNLEGRFQGANGDSPLTLEGRENLSALGQALSQVTFDAVYTSPLKRAQDSTAILLAENQANSQPAQVTPALHEWDLGRLEGQKIATARSIYPKLMGAFYNNLGQFDHTVFAMESVHQAVGRVCDFVQSLDPASHENVLIVSHGAILTASIRKLLGYHVSELRQAGGLNNSSLTLLETSDSQHYQLLDWNDTDYPVIAHDHQPLAQSASISQG